MIDKIIIWIIVAIVASWIILNWLILPLKEHNWQMALLFCIILILLLLIRLLIRRIKMIKKNTWIKYSFRNINSIGWYNTNKTLPNIFLQKYTEKIRLSEKSRKSNPELFKERHTYWIIYNSIRYWCWLDFDVKDEMWLDLRQKLWKFKVVNYEKWNINPNYSIIIKNTWLLKYRLNKYFENQWDYRKMND